MRVPRGPLFTIGLLSILPTLGQNTKTLPTAPSKGKEISTITPVRTAEVARMRWADKVMLDPERNDLPFIHEIRPLGSAAVSFSAHLTNPTFRPLTSAEIAQLPGLGDPGHEPLIRTAIGIERKRPYALVDIYPYRRNSGTGQLEQLVDYELALVEDQSGGVGHLKSATYPDHSKMADGSWYRFTVEEDGVYKLTYQFLQTLGVDVNGLASERINIYGNHAGMLPFQNEPAQPNDLLTNAIEVVDGGDGQFDPNDYLVFYATGAQRWNYDANLERFTHVKDVYSDVASYFVGIDVEPAKRVLPASLTTDPATDQVTVFSDRQFIERDLTNVMKSGRTWLGETYDITTTYNYSFEVPFLHAGDTSCLTVNTLSRTLGTSNSSYFHVQAPGLSEDLTITGVNGGTTSPYGRAATATYCLPMSGSNVLITVTFNKFDPVTSLGWMNYLELNARRDLKFIGDQLAFRDPRTVGAGRIGEFTLDLASSVYRIWEITDPTTAGQVNYTDNGAQKVFRANTDGLREFIAFKNSGYLEPTAVGGVANQDLHATVSNTDLVIVCPDQFLGEAQRLAERRASEGLSVALVTPQQVFNEFSSGQRDATAIKRYMKMLYDRAGSDPALMPRYLLLFGDGSFNNISMAESNQNWIPTWETADSWTPAQNYVSDDYYGLLDDSEGEYQGDLVDIGIGRLPVSDVSQARDAVNKILNYDRLMLLSNTVGSCNTGNDGGANDWRNWVLFASDDQSGDGFEGPIHMSNSDALATKTETLRPCLNVDKVYADAYQQVSTPGGERYFEAQADIRDRVQKGCLLVNYVGHGGEVGWGHERFLDNNTILGWTNLDRLPLFMTATCEFSRWDDPARTSAGENVFLNPSGGGIALMSTTRIAFSSQNQALANYFFDHVYDEEDELQRANRFGDIYRRTKRDITTSQPSQHNHRNFTLLGDPSCRLAMARQDIEITSVTDTLGNPMDTMRALAVVRVNGRVTDENAQTLTDFNGVVVPTVFDKKSTISTLANDPPGQPFNFQLRKNILYRGRATVNSGLFSFTFVVPKDINYQMGPGRISAYAESFSTNACGFTNDKYVGGTDTNAVADVIGPHILLFMNDENFVNGGITNEDPLIYAKLFDENGINTAGSSIGHDLTAVIDANTENAIVLNDVYEADENTYKSGKVRYRLNDLPEGTHTLTMKAWDVYNNSGTQGTEFIVSPSAELALDHVLNYPNPFTTHTDFYFEHNHPCGDLDVQVQVFTVSGRLVKTLNRRLACDGFRSEPMPWDGLDDYGDKLGRGVYVYRLSVATQDGAAADKFDKLVILR